MNGVPITAALKPAGHDCLQIQQISICHRDQAVAVNPTGFTGKPGVTNQLGLLCTRHTAKNHKIMFFTKAVDLKLPSLTQATQGTLTKKKGRMYLNLVLMGDLCS